MKEKFIVNGKFYSSFPEEEPNGEVCAGCSFYKNPDITCTSALDILEFTHCQDRSCKNIIYKEVDFIKYKKKLLIL